MPTPKLTYDGGSLMRPDTGALEDEEGVEYVEFHAECFREDGSWKPEVLDALRELLAWSTPTNSEN